MCDSWTMNINSDPMWPNTVPLPDMIIYNGREYKHLDVIAVDGCKAGSTIDKVSPSSTVEPSTTSREIVGASPTAGCTIDAEHSLAGETVAGCDE